jgi:hypothetical protein
MSFAADQEKLIAQLKEWSQRKNIPDDTLATFLEVAQSRANWALRIPSLEKAAPLPISSTGYIQIPDDFLQMKELNVIIGDEIKILDRKTIQEVDSVAKMYTTGKNPEIFGRWNNYFRIAPWSLGEGYTANIYYYKSLPELTSGETNWFTDSAPNILLYGAMAELCDYTRDTEGMKLWTGKFENEINIVQAVEDNAEWAGSSLAVSVGGSIKNRRGV